MGDLRALALIYDIRGFTAASKRLRTADLGAFATAAHRVVLDAFAGTPPTFAKNLGDGHLLLWECPQGLDDALVARVVEAAGQARTAFAAFAQGQRAAGMAIPGRVGIGVAFGEVSRSDDYYGMALNLAARLQGEARPEGLALDGPVFAAVTRRDAALRERFARARVRLKGLGSTLVYVDRPFSWARTLAPVLRVLLVLALPLGWLLLADAGLSLPGGAALRDLLDARGGSLLRAPVADGEVRQAARVQRERLRAALLGEQVPGGWLRNAFAVAQGGTSEEQALQAAQRKADEAEPDPWSNAQAAYVLARSAAGASDWAAARPVLEVLWRPEQVLERAGEPLGWRPRSSERHAQAEPSFWMLAATAVALGRPGLLEAGERAAWQERLARAQQAAEGFRSATPGGWNLFREQRVPERYSPYSTTLALLALLEVRLAGQGWRGDAARLEALLAQTAAFLGRLFVAEASPPGWRRTAERSDKISAGLTLQACATLLRAEEEAGLPMPPAVLAAIPRLLRERSEAHAYDDYDMGEYIVDFRAPDGSMVAGKEGINFLSHPWAIDCAARWLRRAQRLGAAPGDLVRVRRALGELVVQQGPEAVARATSGYLFVASETLLGLCSVAHPEAP
ncbi:MAG: adenylate/guanylate cyclase domain-containing protein [Planctomycetia bacterium]